MRKVLKLIFTTTFLVFVSLVNFAQSIVINKSYNFAGQYFICNDFIVTEDSNYVLVGMEGSSAINGYFIMKLNSQGDTLWYRQYTDTTNFEPIQGRKIFEITQNNYLIVSNWHSGLIVKVLLSIYDISGNKLIDDTLFYQQKGLFIHCGYKMDNYIYLTINIKDSTGNYNSLFVLDTLLSIHNVIMLPDFIPGIGSELIIEDGNKNLVLAGYQYDSLLGSNVPAIIKIDTTGQILKSCKIPHSSFAIISSIKPTFDNKILFTERFDSTFSVTRLLILDSLFNYNPVIEYSPLNTRYSSCLPAPDFGYYFSYDLGSSVIIEKIDTNGMLIWRKVIPIPHDFNNLMGLKYNWNNDIVISGWSDDGVPYAHPTFFAILRDTTLNTSTVEISRANDINIYPNPSYLGYIRLNYSSIDRDCQFEIYNHLGQKLQAFNYSVNKFSDTLVQINFNYFPAGVYYLIIKGNKTSIVKKFIVL